MTMTAENEQYENKQSFYHLEICCRFVGEKYGNPAITTWTNGDYIKLSSILSRHTDVQISHSTLKRIFGKLKTTERYYPQKATRDALAHYAGYTDWETFVQKHPRPVKAEVPKQQKAEQEIVGPTTSSVQKNVLKKRSWLPIIGLLIAGIAAISIWKFSEKKQPARINTKVINLICNNPEGGNPHSATFKIQLPANFSGDLSQFTVDFGDGRRERPVTSLAVFTHYYQVPGRYYAVLKYNSVPVDTVAVYLKTNGWTAAAQMEHDTTRVYPVNSFTIDKNKRILVNADQLFRSGVDTNRTFFVQFVNTKPLAIEGDNCELTADVNTSFQRPGVRCSQVGIELFGERSKHDIVLMKPGCVSWAHLRFSEIFKDGGTDDLSSIGTDLSNGGIIRLLVADKKVSLFINDKLVFSTVYRVPLKNLFGIGVSFSGIGTVNNLELKNRKTGQIFNESLIAQ